jgi:hypothetical protein
MNPQLIILSTYGGNAAQGGLYEKIQSIYNIIARADVAALAHILR